MKKLEVCRQHGISQQTLYRWKAKYGGPEGNDSRKLRDIQEEKRKLKSIVAEFSLDNRVHPSMPNEALRVRLPELSEQLPLFACPPPAKPTNFCPTLV